MNFEVIDEHYVDDPSSEINRLHAEMTGHMTMAVKKAIEIGRLLSEQKDNLAHGKWIPWIQENLTFNERQAQKYMRAYANRSSYLIDNATSINQAVALLAEPREEPDTEIVYEDKPETLERLKQVEQMADKYETLHREEGLKAMELEKKVREFDAKEREYDEQLRKMRDELTRLHNLDVARQDIDYLQDQIETLEAEKKRVADENAAVTSISEAITGVRNALHAAHTVLDTTEVHGEAREIVVSRLKPVIISTEKLLIIVKSRYEL